MKLTLYRVKNKLKGIRLSIKTKLFLGLMSVAVILLLSSIISIIEYRRMRNYVSELIANNIHNINVTQQLTANVDAYNLSILTLIGDETRELPKFNQDNFIAQCDSLKASISSKEARMMADSVYYAQNAYILTSLELENVISSDFIDSRRWFFNRLQPKYNILNHYLVSLNDLIYKDLKNNSEIYQHGFYRSIMPGVVSVAAGLLLIVMLLFFIVIFYLNPLCRIQLSLKNYLKYGRKYTCDFDGDDELLELNKSIKELSDEHSALKKRVKGTWSEKINY